MKTCNICKTSRPITDFSSNRAKKDGLSGHCKDCHAAYRRTHYVRNRSKIYQQTRDRRSRWQKEIRQFKEKPCADCQQRYPFYVMQFDHLDSQAKKFDLARAHDFSRERVLEEVSKCEVVCANCHSERTWKRFNAGVV